MVDIVIVVIVVAIVAVIVVYKFSGILTSKSYIFIHTDVNMHSSTLIPIAIIFKKKGKIDIVKSLSELRIQNLLILCR